MIELIIFLIYASVIFFIDNYYIFAAVFALNILLGIVFKISFEKTILFIAKLLPFIFFTSGLNIILGDLQTGLVIFIRQVLVCNIVYIFSKIMTPRKLRIAVVKVLTPLKIFKVDTKEIGLMVSISIAFIPIVQREIQNLKFSLESKGFKMNVKNILKKPNYILVPLITLIIKRTVEIEQSLLAKGYMS